MPIYIVSHLPLSPPHDVGYRVMYVGPLSGKPTPDAFAVTDADRSPHIGHKNKTYCELTALHQMALIHADTPHETVGLVHYRRRFIDGPRWLAQAIRSMQKTALTRPFSNTLLRRHELTLSRAEQLLETHDIIVPSMSHLKQSVGQRYLESHVATDWAKLEQLLKIRFPEYVGAFEQFSQSHHIHHFNMFVARSSLLDAYAKWLFSIMDQLEPQIDLSGRDHFQARVFGFLAERLFNVYLRKHKHLKVMHLPIVQLFNESVAAKSST